jgi:hypothetical protein
VGQPLLEVGPSAASVVVKMPKEREPIDRKKPAWPDATYSYFHLEILLCGVQPWGGNV